MNSLGWAPPGWEALKTPVTTVTQICKAKSPYSNGKIKFSKILATSFPRGLFPRTVLLPGSFPAAQFGLRHIRKSIPPSSPLHSQSPLVSPVFLGQSCSVFRPRSHIFFQSLQNLPEITLTVAQLLSFHQAFPSVRTSLVLGSWGRHLPHSKPPGAYQVLIFYFRTTDFGWWKPRGQRPPCPGSSSTLRTCSQNCVSQWNFKYGTALTLGIQTPGSFPLGYEKFIIFAISQILIFTVAVMNVRTYCKHRHKSETKMHSCPQKNPK